MSERPVPTPRRRLQQKKSLEAIIGPYENVEIIKTVGGQTVTTTAAKTYENVILAHQKIDSQNNQKEEKITEIIVAPSPTDESIVNNNSVTEPVSSVEEEENVAPEIPQRPDINKSGTDCKPGTPKPAPRRKLPNINGAATNETPVTGNPPVRAKEAIDQVDKSSDVNGNEAVNTPLPAKQTGAIKKAPVKPARSNPENRLAAAAKRSGPESLDGESNKVERRLSTHSTNSGCSSSADSSQAYKTSSPK